MKNITTRAHRIMMAILLVLMCCWAPVAKADDNGPNPLADRGQLVLFENGQMSEREKTAIWQATQVWNTLIGRPVLIISTNGSGLKPDYIVMSVLGYDNPNTLATTYLAYDNRYITYTEYLRTDPVVLRRVLIHELGHALGLQHSPDKHSVMYFAITEADMPLASEVAEVRARWAL